MNRSKNLFIVIAVFVLLAGAFVFYEWSSTNPPLFIHLRCQGEVSGKLSVAMALPNGELVKNKEYQIKSVCKTGKIEFDDYEGERSLQFSFENSDGKNYKLVSKYGSDIIRDQNEFNIIIAITDSHPFIANDRL